MFTLIRKAFAGLRDAWLLLGITFALLLFVEMVLSAAFHYRATRGADHRISADTYQNANWAQEYYKEFHEAENSRWSSYVYWRRKSYQGQYINVDSQGLRKTWHAKPEPAASDARATVFFFGGSTLWGTGARDDFTIPSIFAKQLAAKGIHANVINFGESGYVSTQEIILLIRELQKGNIPDLVVFYDGVNDTFSAFQQQRAGLPQNEFNREMEFNRSGIAAVHDLSTMRFARGVSRRLGVGRHVANRNREDRSNQSATNEEVLAKEVLDIYEKNMEVVDSLAERYSFKAIFYWQPVVFTKTHVTKYEQEEMQRRQDAQPFFETACQLLSQLDVTRMREAEFHDLTKIFSDMPEPLYVDWCHLGEAGNKYIAERLAMDALSTMGATTAADPEHCIFRGNDNPEP